MARFRRDEDDRDDYGPAPSGGVTAVLVVLGLVGGFVALMVVGGVLAVFMYSRAEVRAVRQAELAAEADEAMVAEVTPLVAPKPISEPIVKLTHLKDKTPWEQYRVNPAAADLKFKGKLVEFVMSAEVQQLLGGRYALVNWMRHNLRAAEDRPMHVVGLKPDQVEKAAGLKKDQVVTIRARLVGGRDDPAAAMGKVVELKDGEILAIMRWDGAVRAYVPE